MGFMDDLMQLKKSLKETKEQQSKKDYITAEDFVRAAYQLNQDMENEIRSSHAEFVSECQKANIPCEFVTNPIHNRISLEQCANLNDWNKGFDKGYPYYELGEAARKAGDLTRAEQLLDKARANGYLMPALYNAYGKLYRKTKDLDNEIAILEEGIRFYIGKSDSTMRDMPIVTKLEAQRQKAIYKKMRESNNQIEVANED